MKFLKRLRTKLLIIYAKRELAERQVSIEVLSKVRARYVQALAESKYSTPIKDSFRHKAFKLAGEIGWHELKMEHLAIRIELLEDSLKC